MPTGYTTNLLEGNVKTFPEFARLCARAFGAMVSFRDDPLTPDLPAVIHPNTAYSDKRLADLKAALYYLNHGSLESKRDQWRTTYAEKLAYTVKKNQENLEHKIVFLEMLVKVLKWNPPTPDHEGLKKFMIEQLELSEGDFDPRPMPVDIPYAQWYAEEKKRVKEEIKYHVENANKEILRAHDRTEWIQDLLRSL